LSSLPKILDELSDLPKLQEIELGFFRDPKLDLSGALRKIAQKGMLKKVKLELGSGRSNLYKFLEALDACKLTHFFLTAFIEKGLINSIAQFIKNMSQLESFGIHILRQGVFAKDNCFIKMCKQINNLQALRSLKLNFQTSANVPRSSRIPNFIPYLADIFLKSTKVETFDIECDQLDPSEALQSLISVLENSAAFLTHLKIGFGDLSCSKTTYQSIRKLMKNLTNIQVLKIPCLVVNGSTSKLLHEIAETVHESKYLRVFEIGKIQKAVSLSAFKETVEVIASKTGLREFRCSLSCAFRKKLSNEPSIGNPNVKRIIEKNPHIEVLVLEEVSPCFTFYPQR